MALPPADCANGEDDIAARAGAVAKEFGADSDRTAQTIKLLFEGLPSLQDQPEDWARSDGLDYAESIVRTAYRALGSQEATEFLNAAPLDLLEERVWICHYLSGTGDEDGIPLFSREELAVNLAAFREFLEEGREHLLETGLPARHFSDCHWLWSRIGRLYPVRRTEFPHPYDEPIECAGMPSFYKWVRVVPKPSGTRAIYCPCRQDEADLIVGLTAVDAEHLSDMRQKVFDVKLAVVTEAERFLRSPKAEGLWKRCLPLLRNALTANEAEFLMRLDRIYAEVPERWKNVSRSLAALSGYNGPLEPGGLTSMVELIGHVDKECTIGTMHNTRQCLGDLILGHDEGQLVLRARGPWSYFDFVGNDDQGVLDNATDVFREGDQAEVAFWSSFRDEVATAIHVELDHDVVVHIAARSSIALQLRKNIKTYAEREKSHLDGCGASPVDELALESEPISTDSNMQAPLPTSDDLGLEEEGTAIADHPVWNSDTGELRLGNRLIYSARLMKHPSNYQRIFEAFQEVGWPIRAKNPLDYGQHQLHQVLYDLNGGLTAIRFRSRQGGKAIIWELR